MCLRALVCLCPPPTCPTRCARCGADAIEPEDLRALGCRYCVCRDCGEPSDEGVRCGACAKEHDTEAA